MHDIGLGPYYRHIVAETFIRILISISVRNLKFTFLDLCTIGNEVNDIKDNKGNNINH